MRPRVVRDADAPGNPRFVVLRCAAGHPVWQIPLGEVVAAMLGDVEWRPPDADAVCLFCGPAGQARARAGGRASA